MRLAKEVIRGSPGRRSQRRELRIINFLVLNMSGQKKSKDGWTRETPAEPYLESADLDYLVRMNTELLSELWIARDRIAVLEQVLVDKGLIGADAVDGHVPDEELSQKLATLRKIMVENVLGAPFKNDQTIETLKAQGRAMASLKKK